MTHEIEVKLWYKDKNKIDSILNKLGAKQKEKIVIVDTYFDNPKDPFNVSEEVLRIRQVGKKSEVTYKGASENDSHIVKRREMNIEINNPEEFTNLLKALGYEIMTEVTDNREIWKYKGMSIEFESKVSKNVARTDYVEIEGPSEEKIQSLIEQLEPHVTIITKEEIENFRFLAGISKKK